MKIKKKKLVINYLLLILFFSLIIFLFFQNMNLYLKYNDLKLNEEKISSKIKLEKEKEKKNKNKIEFIKTKEGAERILIEKNNLKKDGERVIKILDY